MSVYIPTIPQAGDDLSDSQPQILGNFSKADTSFGIDHYKFSNATVNNGKHNKVTTPAFVDNPPTGLPPVTIANEPAMYAFQDSANVGVIDYSRGPSNAIPSPITNLQSTSAAIVLAPSATTNVLDFTGLARAMCTVYAFNALNPGFASTYCGSADVFWNGTALALINNVGTLINIQTTGAILQVKNPSGTTALNNVYWTLKMHRLS